jgi:hypothetical protein
MKRRTWLWSVVGMAACSSFGLYQAGWLARAATDPPARVLAAQAPASTPGEPPAHWLEGRPHHWRYIMLQR